MTTAGPSIDRLTPLTLASLLGTGIARMEPIGGGRNSRVFKVFTVDGFQYAAKLYAVATANARNRLTAEYSSLSFLRDHGVEDVPGTICFDETSDFALYEFIDGLKVPSTEVSNSDIDQATNFLLRLDQAKSAPAAAGVQLASEACFSLDEISQSIDARFRTLIGTDANVPVHQEMTGFLKEELKPAWDEFSAWSADHLSSGGPNQVLEHGLRTLSPSDFGFHNCLRKANGALVFLDFEHFGWDDPAKMISDFLLHPGMDLDHQLKKRFLANMLEGLEAPVRLSNRIEAIYPLFGIKWCLILLNEFQPENMHRRRLARQDSRPDPEIQAVQLAKARDMLNRIRSSYRVFPYHD